MSCCDDDSAASAPAAIAAPALRVASIALEFDPGAVASLANSSAVADPSSATPRVLDMDGTDLGTDTDSGAGPLIREPVLPASSGASDDSDSDSSADDVGGVNFTTGSSVTSYSSAWGQALQALARAWGGGQ